MAACSVFLSVATAIGGCSVAPESYCRRECDFEGDCKRLPNETRLACYQSCDKPVDPFASCSNRDAVVGCRYDCYVSLFGEKNDCAATLDKCVAACPACQAK